MFNTDKWHDSTKNLIHAGTASYLAWKALVGITDIDYWFILFLLAGNFPCAVLCAVSCGLRWFIRFCDWFENLMKEPERCGDKAGSYECCLPKGHRGNCQCVTRWVSPTERADA